MPTFDTLLNTNDQSLDRVLSAGLPVALVLWDRRRGLGADLEEALKRTAQAEAGKLLVVRIDVADNPQAASQWGGAGTPALVAFRDGSAVVGPVHPLTAEGLRAHVDYLLGRGPRPAQAASAGQNGRQAPAQGRTAAGSPDLTRPVTVTDATFQQEVLASAVPVVVDFWAPWCGPCRMIGPVLEKLAAELGGRVKVAKVNVDENPQWAGRYGVQGIPTLLLVRNGQVADRIVGALPEPYLRQRIEAFARSQ